MKKAFSTSRTSGFSLAEVLAALTIGSMILVAALGIYSRAEHVSAATIRKLESSRLPREVLQRIAEDLDGILAADADTTVLPPKNKFDHDFRSAQLTIRKTIRDSRDSEQKLEEIVWQSDYDYEGPTDSLVLYRGHSGMTLEDKVLDKGKDDWERELLVPICTGVTFFQINGVRGEEPVNNWSGSLPGGIKVTISFAEPFKRIDGTWDVPDEEKITRTIAIDRTRKIKFDIAASQDLEEEMAAVDLPEGETLPSGGPKMTEKVK